MMGPVVSLLLWTTATVSWPLPALPPLDVFEGSQDLVIA